MICSYHGDRASARAKLETAARGRDDLLWDEARRTVAINGLNGYLEQAEGLETGAQPAP